MCGILFAIIYKKGYPQFVPIMTSALKEIIGRGPDEDEKRYLEIPDYATFMGFNRLAIRDTSDAGMQPFERDGAYLICNGEIYNYEKIRKQLPNFKPISSSDCEVIIPLYQSFDFPGMISTLDAEFAMVLFDRKRHSLYAARDRYGVRPLFIGWDSSKELLMFASEAKALTKICPNVQPVKPGFNYQFNLKGLRDHLCNPKGFDLDMFMTETADHYSLNSPLGYSVERGKLTSSVPLQMTSDTWRKSSAGMITSVKTLDQAQVRHIIRYLLIDAVKKRLVSDRPIGFLLSGGLDSSLVVSIAAKLSGGPDNITCFSIGLPGSVDVIAAQKVAQHLGIKNHHIVTITKEDCVRAVPRVIKTTETYDITTIRASTPQLLLAEYISRNTNIRVILSGEGSDEIHGGYRYFRDAPSSEEFYREILRLLKNLYLYDNLRTDRTMASCGLEVRVPFLDLEYVQFIMNIDPINLMPLPGLIEKKIVRDSFARDNLLPEEILMRPKEAFSDAVSANPKNNTDAWYHFANNLISDQEFETQSKTYSFNPPKTKEALYYRTLFESYGYPPTLIPEMWLPRFQKKEIVDPSATVLDCY